ncbi:unnamed protein product [Mytilus coruscus]|uniref:Uncharacterized protein n=1 Tax=Mytilus coruscus TaxID=42192 RepID=A0A6J8ETC6_MYTCO|nr:unnamed protein product [Mytilus coruscus]
MARLRFPGRPGCRFGRLGVRYGADEADNFQDPVLAWVANIHRGLRQFRELCGESDEDDEFQGFTVQDVRAAEKKLSKYEADLYGEEEETTVSTVSPDTSFSPTSTPTISTRFTKKKESIENLPTSERTRNRQKTVIRRSYKDLLTKGITKPTKSYVIKSRKDAVTPQAETRHVLASYHKMPKVVSLKCVNFMNKVTESDYQGGLRDQE